MTPVRGHERGARGSPSGDPGSGQATAPPVARPAGTVDTGAGVSRGCSGRRSAVAPAACGAAVDVPDRATRRGSPVRDADVTGTPGANGPGARPWWEKAVRESRGPVAPPVIATPTPAGGYRAAGRPPLPAATVEVPPEAKGAWTAAASRVSAAGRRARPPAARTAKPCGTVPWRRLILAPYVRTRLFPAADAAGVPRGSVTGRLPPAAPGAPTPGARPRKAARAGGAVAETVRARATATRAPAPRGGRVCVRAMVCRPFLDAAYGHRAGPAGAGAHGYASGSLSWREEPHKKARRGGIGQICGAKRGGGAPISGRWEPGGAAGDRIGPGRCANGRAGNGKRPNLIGMGRRASDNRVIHAERASPQRTTPRAVPPPVPSQGTR